MIRMQDLPSFSADFFGMQPKTQKFCCHSCIGAVSHFPFCLKPTRNRSSLPSLLTTSPSKKITMMFRKITNLSFLLLVAPSSLLANTPDNVSSRLMVHVPHSLFKQGGYDHREALFGRPPYGGSIAQNVYYTENDMCDPSKPVTKAHPKDVNQKGEVVLKPPFIMMVDRGGCAFVQKVRNAQRNGAAGVVIADNTCLCSDSECLSHQGENAPPCETAEPVMADDGSGSDVSIPSFLMFKHDADKVKAELMANRPVRLEMQWSLPQPGDRVEYDLFSSPTDPVAYHFFKEFKSIAKALGHQASFTPHMYIFDGVRSQCHGMNGQNQCFNLCSNNGRYCAMDPDKDLNKGISGYDVVKESLRRHCVWSNYGEKDGIGEKWWDYVNEFTKHCGNSDYFNDVDCVRDAYKKAKVDGSLIERCMENSGGLDKDGTNSFLEAEIKAQQELGVVIMPTAFVNKVAIRGGMTSANLFQAICAGYEQGTRPHICDRCSQCGDPAGCAKHGGHCSASMGGPTNGSSGVPSGAVSTHSFFGWMILVIGGFSVLGVWYYKKTKEDMRDQVRGILAEYMPLEDSEEGGGVGMKRMHFAGSNPVQNMMNGSSQYSSANGL